MHRRRAIGWGLIGYGLVGTLLIVVGAALGLDVAGRVERLTTAADDTLAAAARSTRAAADSFANVDGSLSGAQASTDAAAELARDASGTLDALAASMQIFILGTQPLQPLGAEFAASADQAEALAGTLDDVGSSLGATRTDVTRIGVELEGLAGQLEELRASGAETGSAPPIRLFVILLLAWLAIQAVAALVAGGMLLGLARPAPRSNP
ncbi:MAG: hypothetical protein ACRDGD_03035 [Candidatus Limnocylindria bacterium]